VTDVPRGPRPEERSLRAEIARLNKIVNALMDRAERSTSVQGSDFGKFQTAIMLEDQVRRRTGELEASLRENEKIQRALRESEARFRGLVSQSLVGICIIEDGRCTYANPKLAEMFGYSVEETLQLTLRDVATESDYQKIEEQMRRRLRGEVERSEFVFRGLHRNGAAIDIEAHSSTMEMGGKTVLISLMIDITERTRVEREVRTLQDQLREQAIRDPLTGLYNRLPLNEFFDRELRVAVRRRQPISIVLGDLDYFKAVNDTYGHQAGDEALKVFGDLIRRSYRASDIPCRYGGEEFLILLPDMTLERTYRRTERLREALEATPVIYGASTIHLTGSFGVATFPQHGKTREALIAAADRALYAAKDGGRNQIKSYSMAIETPQESGPAIPVARSE
jgi:diguanylate cyclase (GGDEF)-like protein/PAS domain S-box-containing protein